jgi:hypothetical protein
MSRPLPGTIRDKSHTPRLWEQMTREHGTFGSLGIVALDCFLLGMLLWLLALPSA